MTAAGIAAMTAEAFRAPGERMPIGPLGVIGLVGAAVASWLLWDHNAKSFDVVVADNFGLFVTWVLIIVGILSLAISAPTIDRGRLPRGEYYALMLFALAGMMLMATASDLLVIFLALEVLSLAVYVLTGIRRESPASTEAALKYFLLGSFASAFFLYGIAFTYGLTGTTRLDRIGTLHGRAGDGAGADASAGGRLSARRVRVQGVGRAVPHVDARRLRRGADRGHGVHVDRREGGGLCRLRPRVPVGVRAAAEPVARRRLGDRRRDDDRRARSSASPNRASSGCSRTRASPTPGICSSRWSSANDLGKGAVLFYLLTYAVTNLGAFGILAVLETPDRPNDQVRDFAGLWNTHPVLAALMTIFLLSLGGFPPFGGFIAKWYVFTGAVKAGETWLAIIGVLTSVVSVFFYLRIVVMMYMTPGENRPALLSVPKIAGAALVASAIIVLVSRPSPGARPRLGRLVHLHDLLESRAESAPAAPMRLSRISQPMMANGAIRIRKARCVLSESSVSAISWPCR